MLTRPPKCQSKHARRQQHHEARDKVGIAMWGLPVRSDRLTSYLIATTRLTEKQALNPRSCRAAAAKLLDDLAKLADDPEAVARMIEALQRHYRELTRQ